MGYAFLLYVPQERSYMLEKLNLRITNVCALDFGFFACWLYYLFSSLLSQAMPAGL